jgi:hypothetical protein
MNALIGPRAQTRGPRTEARQGTSRALPVTGSITTLCPVTAGGVIRIENGGLAAISACENGQGRSFQRYANPSQRHRIHVHRSCTLEQHAHGCPTMKDPALCRAGSVAPRLQGDCPKARSVGHAALNPSSSEYSLAIVRKGNCSSTSNTSSVLLVCYRGRRQRRPKLCWSISAQG